MKPELCPICKRSLGEIRISKHHLTPKSRGGKHTDTVWLHNICHQKIHSVFTEKELKVSYNTTDKLIAHEEMKKFIKWVAKKDPAFYQKNDQTKNKRSKRNKFTR